MSYMIPFVAAGGLLIALGFLFGGYDIADQTATSAPTAGDAQRPRQHHSLIQPAQAASTQYLGAVLFTIGGAAFGFLVPALSGYIAYAIADRPGIAPGFVGGAIAVSVGAGFIGGLVTGLLAGVARTVDRQLSRCPAGCAA